MPFPKIDKKVEVVFLFDPATVDEISDCELVARDQTPKGSVESFDKFHMVLREMAAAARAENRVVIITFNVAPTEVAFDIARKMGL